MEPDTTLPSLRGGFDQTSIIVGLTRRFRTGSDRADNYAYMAN
jgi:hypothetical protein